MPKRRDNGAPDSNFHVAGGTSTYGTITCRRFNYAITHNGPDRLCRCIPGWCTWGSANQRGDGSDEDMNTAREDHPDL
jgi:hypothetical protein